MIRGVSLDLNRNNPRRLVRRLRQTRCFTFSACSIIPIPAASRLAPLQYRT
jgi:hypothetical protein